MTHDSKQEPAAIAPELLGEMAASVARDMRGEMTPAVRERFILVRSALFQRGIYDPVLVRFDSATAPRATTGEIADQLDKVAASLSPSVA
jgi:hypothetical protein